MRQADDHWLVRPRTVRGLQIGGAVVLALTVIAELWIPIDGSHGIDEFLGFPAVFGFACCVAMVLVAKVLGFVLKRDEDHYDG
jgi:hypothetical protein